MWNCCIASSHKPYDVKYFPLAKSKRVGHSVQWVLTSKPRSQPVIIPIQQCVQDTCEQRDVLNSITLRLHRPHHRPDSNTHIHTNTHFTHELHSVWCCYWKPSHFLSSINLCFLEMTHSGFPYIWRSPHLEMSCIQWQTVCLFFTVGQNPKRSIEGDGLHSMDM